MKGRPPPNLPPHPARRAPRRYLEAHRAPKGRITAEWFGPKKPVASNKTAAGRTKNRRVEMKVLFE